MLARTTFPPAKGDRIKRAKELVRSPMKRTRKKPAPAAARRYWDSLPRWCVVSGAEAVLHHILADAPGKKGRRDHMLVVMLSPELHNMGSQSVHALGSEAAFERVHGVDLVEVAVRNRDNYLGAMEEF